MEHKPLRYGKSHPDKGAGPAVTTQDADPFELSVSCVGVVPSLAPAEFCTTSPHRRYQNIFCEWSSSPLNVRKTSGGRTAWLLWTWAGFAARRKKLF